MWSRDSDPSSGVMRVLSAVAFKSQVVVRSLMAFVLMSTVTALTVRTLLSSGVVIMFPMVMLLERMGLQGVDMQVGCGFGVVGGTVAFGIVVKSGTILLLLLLLVFEPAEGCYTLCNC